MPPDEGLPDERSAVAEAIGGAAAYYARVAARVWRAPLEAAAALTVARALLRTFGLALAIIPCFLGFVPALFDRRRRALPDYLAGTVVVYDDGTGE
jgi:hypothetical protein